MKYQNSNNLQKIQENFFFVVEIIQVASHNNKTDHIKSQGLDILKYICISLNNSFCTFKNYKSQIFEDENFLFISFSFYFYRVVDFAQFILSMKNYFQTMMMTTTYSQKMETSSHSLIMTSPNQNDVMTLVSLEPGLLEVGRMAPQEPFKNLETSKGVGRAVKSRSQGAMRPQF